MKRTVPIIIVFAILLLTYERARADSLRGFIVNESGTPIPGLTVSIARPDFRSQPSITDSSGHYFFANVPSPGNWYLEVYWGKDLVYRKDTVIKGDSTEPPIKLHR